ncbi:hypothetical protein [Dethiothermospora halolimnae]|uniref:hypothetical protein n=1 Tax=Dethiothermospora halolimnae TaxID=3114390 RepID=UPI003CCC1EFE
MVSTLKRKLILFTALAIGILTIFTGCEKRIMFVSDNIGNNISAKYRYFDGDEGKTIYSKDNDKINIEYDVTVDKGKLIIKLEDKDDNVIWEKDFSENEKSNVTLDIEKDKKYRLTIIGEETKGKYNIKLDK